MERPIATAVRTETTTFLKGRRQNAHFLSLNISVRREKILGQYVANYSPELTDQAGRLTLYFKSWVVRKRKQPPRNVLLATLCCCTVLSIGGVDASVVDPSTCKWAHSVGDDNTQSFTQAEVWAAFSRSFKLEPVIDADAVQMPRSLAKDSCAPALHGGGR